MAKYLFNRTASGLLRPLRGRVLALCVCLVLFSALQVGVALITRDLVDAAIHATGQLFQWGAALLWSMLSMVLLHALYSWVGGSTGDRCVAMLRRALLQRAAYSDDTLQQHSGSFVSRGMEDVRVIADGLVNVIPSMAGQLMRLIGGFAMIIALFPALIWVILLGAMVVAMGVVCIRPILKKHHARVRDADEQVMTSMQENVQNLELIKGLGAEDQMLLRFDQRVMDFFKAHAARRVVMVSRSTVVSLISQLGSGALLVWGAFQVSKNAMSYGSLAAMLQLLALLKSPIFGLSGLWTRISAVEVSKNRLEQILAVEPAPRQSKNITCVKSIVFDNVTFTYPGDNIPVLNCFSTQLDLQEWVCMTGISGRGKTTMFKLILGLYKPQSGRVYLVTDQGEIPCDTQTRHLFAYVPQDYALLSGSILDNLLLAVPNATQEQIYRALELAQASFVWELPAKENTLVRENNAGLSMGQMQRLAVARAILMDRQIFLLDECTSALDADTEEALLSTLVSIKKQGILVTHRPQALHNIDAQKLLRSEL